MAILSCPSGKVEVRLRKARSADSEVAYFDEFEKVEVVETVDSQRSARYLVPELCHYAVEVILKQGYYFGSSEGVRVKIYDKGSNRFISQKLIPKLNLERLMSDNSTLIETVSGGNAGGKFIQNARLTFECLAMDETLDRETDVAGIAVASLGGLRICVCKCSAKSEVAISEREFARQLARHKSRQGVSQVQSIDEVSYNKDGITHIIGLSGGFSGRLIEAPTQTQMVRKETDKLSFDFICRSQGFLENNSFMRCPLPQEFQPWDLLRAYQREVVFGVLQAHMNEHAPKQGMVVGEQNTHIDDLKEIGFITPNSQNKWYKLSAGQRKAAFMALQHLRIKFENRKTSSTPISNLDSTRHPVNGHHKTSLQALAQFREAPVLQRISDHITFDADQGKGLSGPIPRPVIIAPDDPAPRSKPRNSRTRSLSTQADTQTEPIDLNNFVSRSNLASEAKLSRFKPETDDQREHKRTKFDPSEDRRASSPAKTERSSQELERRNAEIAKIARLYREAEELKAMIETMEENNDDEESDIAFGSAAQS